MTEAEFTIGWKLLLLQPWAYRYRGVNEFREPSPDAKGQWQFYYEHLKNAAPAEWVRIATEYAKGKEWPAVDTLKRSLTSIAARTYYRHDPADGPLLSLDEFGRDRYDAIRLQSAQVQQEKNAVLYDKQGWPKMAATARRAAETLRLELGEIFTRETIQGEELRRVLAIGAGG